MSVVYMAKRQIYPDQTKLFGPYENYVDALACARDSFYPFAGDVIEIDLGALQSTYTPISTYQDWELKSVTTIYIFTDEDFHPPSHWSSSLIIEVVTREDTEKLECPDEVCNCSEHLLISKIAFFMSDQFTKVIAIRDSVPGALTFVMLEGYPQPAAIGKGFQDRAELLNLAYHATRIMDSEETRTLESYNEADCIFSSFWRRFVDATSNGPKDWAAPWY